MLMPFDSLVSNGVRDDVGLAIGVAIGVAAAVVVVVATRGVALGVACARGVGVTTATLGGVATSFAPTFAVSLILECSEEKGCGR